MSKAGKSPGSLRSFPSAAAGVSEAQVHDWVEEKGRKGSFSKKGRCTNFYFIEEKEKDSNTLRMELKPCSACRLNQSPSTVSYCFLAIRYHPKKQDYKPRHPKQATNLDKSTRTCVFH
jgi:hypothetical protein